MPDKQTKTLANQLDLNKFRESELPSTNRIVYYFGYLSLVTINLTNLSCSCAWFQAYACCKHLTRAINRYDIQNGSAHFQNRRRGAAKTSNEENAIDERRQLQLAVQSLLNSYRWLLGLPPCNIEAITDIAWRDTWSTRPWSQASITTPPVTSPHQWSLSLSSGQASRSRGRGVLPVASDTNRGVGRPKKVPPALEFQ